jgi:hypothetical protein
MNSLKKRNSRQEAGNSLLIVMVIIGLLIAALGTYLTMSSQENNTVMRSACWNNAMPLAEAGIEEAMTHIVRNTNGYAVDGWSANGTNYYKQRFLSNDFYNVSFHGDIFNGVTIVSTGAVQWTDGSYISRVVEVTARARQYPKSMGLVARGLALGGTLSVDSYDTSTNTYSNPLKLAWYDPTRRSASAFVGNPLTTFIAGGNVDIRGYAASARGYSPPIFAGSAAVGDLNFSGKGAQAGHSTNGFYVEFPDVYAPYKTASTPTTNTVNGVKYTYYLNGNDYYAANLSNGASMYVTGYCRLYVTGAVDIASITFATNGVVNNARLDLYVGGPSITFAPNVNGAIPPQFTVWGLPTCKAIKFSGNINFVGAIYAPEADLAASGGATMFGAISANTFKCNGNFTLHQDLAIGKGQPPDPVTIGSWAEL